MSSRSGHGYQIAAAAQGLRDHDVATGAIEHQVGDDALAPRRRAIQMTHSPQVAFSFFSDIADKEQISGGFDSGVRERGGERQQGRYAGSVVAGPRRRQTMVVEYRRKGNVAGKNGVDMRGENGAGSRRR